MVAETVVEVNQPGAGGGVSAGAFGMVCDGRWHRVDVTVSSTSGSPFVPGLADVDARFTVLDPESFDPLPQGVDSRRVWLQAPAQVFVFWRGALDEAGNAPWRSWRVVSPRGPSRSFRLNSPRASDAGQGHSNDFGLACDGRWFHRALKVIPSPGSFEPGKSEANASLSILDPNTGDPVYTLGSSATSGSPARWRRPVGSDGSTHGGDRVCRCVGRHPRLSGRR